MPGVATLHGLYGVVFDTTIIGGITQQAINTGTEVRGDALSGEVYNRFQSQVAQKPGASFTTLNIAAALAESALSGVSIAALTAGFTMWAQKHAEGGSREGTLSHRKYVFNEGLIVPRTLSVDHQGDASISYDVIATYDGTNDPVVITDSQTLTTGLADAERFTMGPVTIESVTIAQVRSFEIDFGINAVTEGADSEVWDRYAHIVSINPTITLRGIDVEWLKAANIPLAGLNATHANTKIYLRKRAAGGTFVTDVTAEHVKFTAAGLVYVDGAMDASGNEAAEVSLTMPLKYDGTLAPLVITTASAIT